MIGTQIEIKELDLHVVGYGAVVMLISLIVRIATTFFAVMTPKFTWRDRLFLALSWIPKATVQVLLGGVKSRKKASFAELSTALSYFFFLV